MSTPAGPVRVVHLITLLEFGGAQGNTIHTVTHLNPHRFETHLWSGSGAYWDSDVRRDLEGQGRLRFFSRLVRQINPFYDLRVIHDLWKAFRAARPMIVHTHSSKAGIVGRIAAWLAGVPILVHTFHGFGFNDRQKPWTRTFFVGLERLIAGLADRLIFVSRSNWEEAAGKDIGRVEQYVLIRSGVPLDAIRKTALRADRAALRRSLDIPLAAPIIATIGAFKPQKNLPDFIEMARRLSQRFPDARFLILGDGELRTSLERQRDRAGLKDRILMPGWRRDAAELLCVADIFVLTSLWEGLPRALVEAMAIGLPSVCYDTDGVGDLLDGRCGIRVPRGDIDRLTIAVEALLGDATQRREMGARACASINQEFDIDHMVHAQENLYETLLSGLADRRGIH